jgi:hypothetical protein
LNVNMLRFVREFDGLNACGRDAVMMSGMERG